MKRREECLECKKQSKWKMEGGSWEILPAFALTPAETISDCPAAPRIACVQACYHSTQPNFKRVHF